MASVLIIITNVAGGLIIGLTQHDMGLAEAFVKGKYALAARKADEAVAATRKRQAAGLPVEGTEEKDAALVLDAVKVLAEIRILLADRLAKDRWSLDAREILEGVATGFAGTPSEAKAKERLAAIEADPRAQAEITATLRLREILAVLRPLTRKKVEKAIAGIDDLLALYATLQAGERARAEKAKLEKLLEPR